MSVVAVLHHFYIQLNATYIYKQYCMLVLYVQKYYILVLVKNWFWHRTREFRIYSGVLHRFTQCYKISLSCLVCNFRPNIDALCNRRRKQLAQLTRSVEGPEPTCHPPGINLRKPPLPSSTSRLGPLASLSVVVCSRPTCNAEPELLMARTLHDSQQKMLITHYLLLKSF